METSAPKRRKVSSTSNVPVDPSGDASNQPAPASGSSDVAARRSSTRRRPSFASPTKSSLARANPDVLERRNAERQQRSANSAPAASWPGSNSSSDGSASGTGAAQLKAASETRPPSQLDPVDSQVDVTEPMSALVASQTSLRRLSGRILDKPARRRSNNPKPSPRPLPRPSSKEEELLDPFKGRVLRRSPPPAGVLPTGEPEEPKLPPTPTKKGISDPAAAHTPPSGIHNTSSKRPKRSWALAERLKSSPLKQPPMRPDDDEPVKVSKSFSPSRIRVTRSVSRQSFVVSEDQNGQTSTRKPHPARGVKEFDPLAEKKALRDSLLSDIAALEADMEIVTKENDRIYQLQQPHPETPVSQKPENIEALLDVLCRHTLPPEKEPAPDQTQNWLEQALNPISFLPFGNPASTFPSPFAPAAQPEEPRPPISHHPIPMTAEDELPYLQLFTPLVFTSNVSLLPRSLDEDQNPIGPLLQKHAIAANSTPPGLFTARIDMIVNPKYLVIDDLSVPRLEPAATAELGPFIEKVVAGKTSSALRKNVGVITWAMAEWTRIAIRRARFWCTIDRELGDREGVVRCVKKMRKGNSRGGAGRPANNEEEDNEQVEEHLGGRRKSRFTKSDILPHLGRASIDLDLGGPGEDVSLRVEWKIEFDWTGEGQSRIGVLVGAPGKWHNQDNRGSLAAIPEMFDKLVQQGEDLIDAVKTVVALLVGEVDN